MTQISPVSKAKKVMISFGCAVLACWRISPRMILIWYWLLHWVLTNQSSFREIGIIRVHRASLLENFHWLCFLSPSYGHFKSLLRHKVIHLNNSFLPSLPEENGEEWRYADLLFYPRASSQSVKESAKGVAKAELHFQQPQPLYQNCLAISKF